MHFVLNTVARVFAAEKYLGLGKTIWNNTEKCGGLEPMRLLFSSQKKISRLTLSIYQKASTQYLQFLTPTCGRLSSIKSGISGEPIIIKIL